MRVVIADDHPLFRSALTHAVSPHSRGGTVRRRPCL